MEETGEYVQNGDIFEWRWFEGYAPEVKVPEGEFDPRTPAEPSAPEPVVEPAPVEEVPIEEEPATEEEPEQ